MEVTKSIRYTFIVTMTIILFIGTLVLCAVLATYEGLSTYNYLHQKGHGFALYVAKLSLDPLILKDSLQLDAIVNEVDNEDIMYTVVADAAGNIATSQFASLNYECGRIAAIKGTFAGLDGLPEIISHIKSTEATLEVSAPVVTGDETIGTVTVGLSKYNMFTSIGKSVLVVILVNILVAAILGFVLYSASETLLLRPISGLADAANRIAGGDLETRVNVDAVGEMALLVDSFNRMTEDLQKTTVSREYVDSIIRSMTEGLVILSTQRRITDVNHAAVALLGYERAELLDLEIDVFMERDMVREAVDGMGGAHPVHFETSCRRKDGVVVPVYFSASGMLHADGTVRGIVCCLLDITDMKQVSLQLEQTNAALKQEIDQRKHAQEEVTRLNDNLLQRTEDLERVVYELESFSYSVSHDLRAPLRGIDGFSMALLEDYGDKLDQEGKDYLVRIRNGCTRMGKLIDDLLRLSRITRADIRRSRVDLSDMARQVVDELQHSEPDRKVELQIQPGLVVDADPVLIRSVLENLLGNAWKFTRPKDQPRIQFGATEESGTMTFFVRDNGAGFNMEYVDKLFGAFQRLHRSDEFEGTGIGLASVKRVIHRHGGRAWAEATEGEGAAFYFSLGGENRWT